MVLLRLCFLDVSRSLYVWGFFFWHEGLIWLPHYLFSVFGAKPTVNVFLIQREMSCLNHPYVLSLRLAGEYVGVRLWPVSPLSLSFSSLSLCISLSVLTLECVWIKLASGLKLLIWTNLDGRLRNYSVSRG